MLQTKAMKIHFEGVYLKPKVILGIAMLILSQVEFDLVRAVFSIIGLGDMDYLFYQYIFFFVGVYVLFTDQINTAFNFVKDKMRGNSASFSKTKTSSSKTNSDTLKEIENIFSIHKRSIELYEKDEHVREKLKTVVNELYNDISKLIK